MSDIPADILQAADEAAQACVDCAWAAGEPVNPYLPTYIAKAILAERERCARIVENPHRSMLGMDEDAVDFLTSSLARSIRDGRVHAPNRDAN